MVLPVIEVSIDTLMQVSQNPTKFAARALSSDNPWMGLGLVPLDMQP